MVLFLPTVSREKWGILMTSQIRVSDVETFFLPFMHNWSPFYYILQFVDMADDRCHDMLPCVPVVIMLLRGPVWYRCARMDDGHGIMSCEVLFPVMNGRGWIINWQAYIGIALVGFDDSCLPHSDAYSHFPQILHVTNADYRCQLISRFPPSLHETSSDPGWYPSGVVSCAAVQVSIR